MAATAHSDPYAIFLRKIGYSVGLEFTAERVEGLVSRYLQERDLTVGGWHQLVSGSKEEGNWARDKSAEKHIADFLYSLRLVQRTAGDVLILENLDAIAITSSILKNASEREAARGFLLLWGILVNDGEIFVNLLLAGFQEQQIKDTLTAMMGQKRTDLSAILAGKVSAKRINRVITIERQSQNKGSAGAGQSVTSLRRTEPLQVEHTFGRLVKEDNAIEFSDDYFRKVPPRRRDWASSLGLWDDEKPSLTQLGHEFVDGLRETGYIDAHDRFTFWPMNYELVRSGFRPDLFGEETKSLWACLVDFAGAYAGLRVKAATEGDSDTAVSLIGNMIEVFRSLHIRKAMLRRELPITVAYPAAIAMACAEGKPVLDLPVAIAEEQKGEERRLGFRQSRHTGGTLSVRR